MKTLEILAVVAAISICLLLLELPFHHIAGTF